MTTPAPIATRSLFRNVGRENSDTYQRADPSYRLPGTLVPTAKPGHDHSGFKGTVEPSSEEVVITKDLGENKGMVNIIVNARAMEILKQTNSTGGKMTFEEAVEAELRERQIGHFGSDGVEPATEEEIPQPIAVAGEKPKRGSKKVPVAGPPAPSPRQVKKISVRFDSPLGHMTILADKAFVAGPGEVCLVLVQDSPTGDFFIPPQIEGLVDITINATVYKCLTGTYYQIPGTTLMHVIYFIHREDDPDEPREA